MRKGFHREKGEASEDNGAEISIPMNQHKGFWPSLGRRPFSPGPFLRSICISLQPPTKSVGFLHVSFVYFLIEVCCGALHLAKNKSLCLVFGQNMRLRHLNTLVVRTLLSPFPLSFNESLIPLSVLPLLSSKTFQTAQKIWQDERKCPQIDS